MKRVIKDFFWKTCIYLSAIFTVTILAIIIGFILYKGLPGINKDFLTNMWEDKTTFVMTKTVGVNIGQSEENKFYIESIEDNSFVKQAKDLKGNNYPLRVEDQISKIDKLDLEELTLQEVEEAMKNGEAVRRVKIVRTGGGILPMLVSTLYLIVLSLMIAAPIGILSAIYLNEYAKKGKLLNIIRFAIQNLAGIPSIIYGLFGMLFFVGILKMQYSILAGACTISIILLPTIISTAEEALKSIPIKYREASMGLGATKLQTIYKVVIPNAIPGILVAVILSIGRIVGESAALILTAGTVAQIPKALVGTEAGASTLTVKMYWLLKETGDLEMASSIAIILLGMIVILNYISKLITKGFLAK
jgi:phosphate transport system permease protein